jgi:hypothetical protein
LTTAPDSTVEHPNAALLRAFYDAFGAADRDRLARQLAPDMVWHFPGTSPISGDWAGVDGLLGGIRAVAMAMGQGHNSFELLHVTAGEGFAITVHRDTYVGEGNHLDLRYVLYCRIVDDRIAEVFEIPFDQAENDRYFAVQGAALARAAGGGP